MEQLLETVIMYKNCSVKNTEHSVAQQVGQQVVPYQLENAALPHHHQVDETLAPLGRVPVPIGVHIPQHSSGCFLQWGSE